MKKIFTVFLATIVLFSFFACGSNNDKEELYILNWGEYMDMDLVDKFEAKYNCEVIYDEVSSNEEMYTKLKANTTSYDLMFPSEYMVDKMMQEDLLNKIDKTAIDFDSFYPKSLEILRTIDKNNDYAIPYVWGTLGIMYNDSVKDIVVNNGYKVLFEDFSGIEKIGMYNGAKDSIASALLYLGYDVNTADLDELKAAEEALMNMDYEMFGDDNLKTNVVSGNLDVALVYSGDFLTAAYEAIEDGRTIDFGYYAPDTTNLWVDTIVIPKTSQNQELANKFIAFICDSENALQNSYYIGYCPTIMSAADAMINDEELEEITTLDSFIPYHEGMNAKIYKYEGQEHYQMLDDIFTRIKG